MATTAPPLTSPKLLTMEKYLRTFYRPDREFVDGHLEERNLGEFNHARLQTLLAVWFFNREKEWNVQVVMELRTRVASTRVRIPDVSVLRADAPREPVTLTPPLLCIEILSPEDRTPRVSLRMKDFLSMGVEHLWIIDPIRKVGYIYTSAGQSDESRSRLEVPGTPIFLDLPTLFAALD